MDRSFPYQNIILDKESMLLYNRIRRVRTTYNCNRWLYSNAIVRIACMNIHCTCGLTRELFKCTVQQDVQRSFLSKKNPKPDRNAAIEIKQYPALDSSSPAVLVSMNYHTLSKSNTLLARSRVILHLETLHMG